MRGLYSQKTVAELLKKYELAPLKKLGQNFLCDEKIVGKISEAAVLPGENAIEIGPGLGVLSDALARRAKKLVCIEIDAGMVRALGETLAEHENTEVLHADALKIDFSVIAEEYFGEEPYVLVGNLPYYITSKLLLAALETRRPPARIVAMVQKEVAFRLAARPGDHDYGALTASVGYYGGAKLLFPVSSGCFFPRPEVESAVIELIPKPAFEAPRDVYCRVVRGMFAMRRKTAVNNMKQSLGLNVQESEFLLAEANASEKARAEELSCAQFDLIARKYLELRQNWKK